MEKLLFEKNSLNTYTLKKTIYPKESTGSIYNLGSFLYSYVSYEPDRYLNFLFNSNAEGDITGYNEYFFARVEDKVFIYLEGDDLETASDYDKYMIPYDEMIKILKIWKMLVEDKNSPQYLTIEEENKKFTMIASNEIPEELKEDYKSDSEWF
jgi:hypothetical protein